VKVVKCSHRLLEIFFVFDRLIFRLIYALFVSYNLDAVEKN